MNVSMLVVLCSWVFWLVRRLVGCPRVVTLCGSTRFLSAFQEANLCETLRGRLVFSIGCDTKSDAALFAVLDGQQKASLKRMLDGLHQWKIVLSDEILVLNVGGYVGDSTFGELCFARCLGKRVRWLEGPAGAQADSRHEEREREDGGSVACGWDV